MFLQDSAKQKQNVQSKELETSIYIYRRTINKIETSPVDVIWHNWWYVFSRGNGLGLLKFYLLSIEGFLLSVFRTISDIDVCVLKRNIKYYLILKLKP